MLQSIEPNSVCAHIVRTVDISRVDAESNYLFPGAADPMYRLLYVEDGKVHVIVEGKPCYLQPGESVLIGSGQWYMAYADDDAPLRLLWIQMECAGDPMTTLLNRKLELTDLTHRIMQQVIEEWEHQRPYYVPVITHQMSLLLLLLLRQAEEAHWTAERPNGEHEIIRRAQSCAAARCREKLTVPLMAQHTGVSPSYLTALFQKNLGISPGEYIRRVKLQESKRLIREGRLNFTEIAELLQYSTVHQFSRQFKDKFGMTPSDYAKQSRKMTEMRKSYGF